MYLGTLTEENVTTVMRGIAAYYNGTTALYIDRAYIDNNTAEANGGELGLRVQQLHVQHHAVHECHARLCASFWRVEGV